ncbi:MAG: hypothetical protein J6Y62_02095 [Clostridia bacterium]|nr:hypothetical protein [Clostridia bacterium]
MRDRIVASIGRLIADLASSDYVHDPEHRKKPSGGGWHETEKGWSRKEPVREKRDGGPPEGHAGRPAAKMAEYADAPEKWKRKRAARDPRTPPEKLLKLADEKSGVKGDALKNPSMPEQALRDNFGEYRWAVIQNPSCPRDLMEEVLNSKDPADAPNKWNLAEKPFLPRDLIEKYLTEGDKDVRQGLARNPSLTSEQADRLAEDSDRNVVAMVALNPRLSREAFERLYQRNKGKVSNFVLFGLAGNASATPESLEKLAKEPDSNVKATAAANFRIGQDLLEKLSRSDYADVLWNAASNPKLSEESMKRLAKDTDEEVRNMARDNLLCRAASPEERLDRAVNGSQAAANYIAMERAGRRDFCMGELQDEETYEQLKGYKKGLGGKKGRGRTPDQIKQDFIKNMDPAKYGSPEEFRKARERIQKMPAGKFDQILAAVYQEEDEIDF